MDELVLMSETMVEKKLEDIAVKMLKEHAGTRFILIAGPSSAGKTTFSKRLSIHLKIHGKEPIAISMDDFYKNLMYNIKDINTILTGEPEDDERILQGRRLHSEAWTGNFG